MIHHRYTTRDLHGTVHAMKMFGPEVPGKLSYCGVMATVVEKLSQGQINCPACRKLAGIQRVRVGAQGVPHQNGPNHEPHKFHRH
jgi:hypothetical protein